MAQPEEIIARYARRAEELRTIAGQVRDSENHQALLEWASTYERLVQRAVEVVTTYVAPAQPKPAEPDKFKN